jgi:hypothetical protein
MTDTVQIFLSNASLDDPAAMAALLAPLRDGGAMAKLLAARSPGCTVAYDPAANTARFIVNDGKMASCFSVVGINRGEAASLSRACEEKTDWSLKSFQATVAATLGGSIEQLN